MMNPPTQHQEGNTTKTIVLIEDDPDVLRMMHHLAIQDTGIGMTQDQLQAASRDAGLHQAAHLEKPGLLPQSVINIPDM